MEEEYVCISTCAKSVTHWQRVLLLAVLNLDQKPAVSVPMPRKRAVWFCTPHSTAVNGTRSYKYSNREYIWEEPAHVASVLREAGASVKSQIPSGSLSAAYCFTKRQTFLAPDDFLLQAGLSVICERKLIFQLSERYDFLYNKAFTTMPHKIWNIK